MFCPFMRNMYHYRCDNPENATYLTTENHALKLKNVLQMLRETTPPNVDISVLSVYCRKISGKTNIFMELPKRQDDTEQIKQKSKV